MRGLLGNQVLETSPRDNGRPETAGGTRVHVAAAAPAIPGSSQLQADLVVKHVGRRGSTWTCIARQSATRTALLSGASVRPSTMTLSPGGSTLGGSLQTPKTSVRVTNGHLPGPVVGVLERCDHLDCGIGTEPVCVGHLQHDLHPGLTVLGDFGDEHVGTLAVAKLAGVVVGRELQFEAQCLEELRGLAQLWVFKNTASIPSVDMSALLPRR